MPHWPLVATRGSKSVETYRNGLGAGTVASTAVCGGR